MLFALVSRLQWGKLLRVRMEYAVLILTAIYQHSTSCAAGLHDL